MYPGVQNLGDEEILNLSGVSQGYTFKPSHPHHRCQCGGRSSDLTPLEELVERLGVALCSLERACFIGSAESLESDSSALLISVALESDID